MKKHFLSFRWLRPISVLCALFFALPSHAIPLLPGTTIPGVGEPDPIGGAVVATLTDPFVGGTPPNDFAGSITSTVILGDVTNPFGPGALTFTYMFSITAGTEDIGRLTVEGYAGLMVDASWQVPPAGVFPALIDRSLAALNGGDVVGFIFLGPPGPGQVGPGMMSALLVLQTDATTYTTREGNIINGASTEVVILAPGVPDGGATLLLLGSALLGIEALRRKFRLKS